MVYTSASVKYYILHTKWVVAKMVAACQEIQIILHTLNLDLKLRLHGQRSCAQAPSFI